MKLNAEIVERTYKQVNINPSDALLEIKNQWLSSIGRPAYQYININMEWEHWEDTHGSGLYFQHGNATKEELDVYNAFETIRKLIKDFK